MKNETTEKLAALEANCREVLAKIVHLRNQADEVKTGNYDGRSTILHIEELLRNCSETFEILIGCVEELGQETEKSTR